MLFRKFLGGTDEKNQVEDDQNDEAENEQNDEVSDVFNYDWNDELDEGQNSESNDESMEYLQLVSSSGQLDINLHDFTNVKTNEFCRRLLIWLRQGNVCKQQCEKILELFRFVLPIPNHLPRSMKDLLVQANGMKKLMNSY